MAKCSLLALMFTKWLLSKMDKFFARPVKMTARGFGPVLVSLPRGGRQVRPSRVSKEWATR